jgi:hypothetical protein
MMDGRRSQKINLRALCSTHSLAVLVHKPPAGVIKDCEFDSHSLRQLHDFLRQAASFHDTMRSMVPLRFGALS